jgi:hypothetical protein
MPPKKTKRSKAPKQNTKTNELQEVTRLLKLMNKPKNEVTDLGRALLGGGNALSGLFGFPKIFGKGDYTMSNTMWNASSQVPVMHSSSESMTLRHREYIGDVVMSGPTFTQTAYPINPGLAATFPYLSSVAECFQQYRFKGLVFEFKSTSAAAITSGTNTAMGSIMLAAQYRADALPFINKQQVLNEMWSVDIAPSSCGMLPIECSPEENTLSKQYVRTGGIAGGDVKMYDLATVYVATQGGQVGQSNIVGELWVTYEIELSKPCLASQISPTESPNAVFVTAATTNALPFNGMVPYAANTLLGITVTGGNTINFSATMAPGFYSITMYSFGTVAATLAFPAVTFTGSIRLANPSAIPAVATTPGGSTGVSGTQFYQTYYLFVGGAGTVTFGNTGVYPGSTLNTFLWISPFGANGIYQ